MNLGTLRKKLTNKNERKERPGYKEMETSTDTIYLTLWGKNYKLIVHNDGWVAYKSKVDGKSHTTVFHIREVKFSYWFATSAYGSSTVACEKEEATMILATHGEMRIYDNIQSNQGRKDVEWREDNRELSRPDCQDEYIDKLEEEEKMSKLGKAMDSLTDKQREVIKFYYFDQMTQDEISQKLGISRTAVEDRLAGALKKLRKNF